MKRLGVFYREKILSLPKESLELKEMPSIHLSDTRVEKDLFGWKLTYNKRRSIRDSIKCRSEEEARYIKALNDSGFPDIFVPKDEEYLKSILPELEYLKMRADEIIDRFISGIFSRTTRSEITAKVFAELRDDESTEKLAIELFPELKDVLLTDYDITTQEESSLIFQQIRAGGDRNFGYLIGDEYSKQSVVVDVSYLPEEFIIIASQHKLRIKYIISTHDHGDHTDGNAELKERTDAKIVMHKMAPDKADVLVDDGDVIKLGELELKVIYTPGHTLDAICILVENKLLTGDTLFVGKVGGTHTDEFARIEYDSLLNKLMKLDDSIEIYPGHDYGVAPTSTIGNERITNPFLLRKDFKDFKWLKDNWASYKLEHGIK